jgi:hypothetical protein
MKKITILSAVILISFGFTRAQDPGAPAGGTTRESKWTGADRSEFITECVNSAKSGMSEDSAKYYCYCMLTKVEEAYPDPKDIGELDEEALDTPEWVAKIEKCLGGYWPKSAREEFLTSCIKTATPKIGETKAVQYCECMMFKIEHRYPVFTDAINVKDKLNTPEWKKVISSCQF